MKRIYHPFHLWEDYQSGMWRIVSQQEQEIFLNNAISFTGDTELYGSWMLRIIEEWPYACQHNLTHRNMNRQAWIGHAACSLAINCPEYITRLAWWELTEEQRTLANLKADFAILKWEENAKTTSRN